MNSSIAVPARALLLLNLAACAYATPAVHIPESLPIAPAHLELEDVIVMDGDRPADAALASEVRGQTAEILERALGARSGGAAQRAKVSVRVDLEWKYDIYDAMREDGIAVVAWLPATLGVAIGRQRVSAEVTVEVGDRTFVGHGTGEKIGSIYASPRRRALATALDQALAESRVEPL